ncbi:MAG: SpoIIE family protein phosphatase [Flavobacteriales bacterium]|nr:SpoIIE family protein phosphatase [Flavobacteriales bacterium]MCB9173111.1 SpoIIE family protein phosphatase [Flavobacteriales bacterium]
MNNLPPTIDWKQELEKSTQKYHLITCWVGVIFNLLFFAADYLTLPEYWMPFLVFRVSVSFLIFLAIVGYKKGKIPIELLGFIPVVLISIENAYMWSFMDVAQFQKHTFAYMALFIGSGMFVLYRNIYSIIIVVVSLLVNVVLLNANSSLSLDEILVNGGLLTFAVALFSMFLIRTRFNLTKKEVIARLALKASNEELSLKKEIIEEKNKEITDSIQYAKRIQQALITPEEVLKKNIPNSFVFFQPKDIVSGDFYWVAELSTTKENEQNEKLCVFSVADCTGHGVPGAFMSLIGIKILNQSIKEKDINSPAEALDFVNNQVFDTVNKHTDENNIVRDGMDAVLFAINFNTLSLSFAGANNALYIVRDNDIIELKGDKQPIGSYSNQNKFTNVQFQLQKNDVVYASTDGFPDQFGGEDGKKLKSKRFKEKLIECSSLPIEEQKNELQKYFNAWKGNLEQLDDICVLGIKI